MFCLHLRNHLRVKSLRLAKLCRNITGATLFFLASVAPGFAAEYTIAPAASWVEPVTFSLPVDVPVKGISSGVYYLLSDSQVKVAAEGDVDSYFHTAIQVINSSGVTDASQVSVSFDPEYEQIILHAVRVHRGAVQTDQLEHSRINVLQRESQLEYQLYDGTRSLNLILDDVRIGDIIEYSYTCKGNNPVFDGHYFASIATQWGVPVAKVRNRLLWPAGRPLFVRNHATDLQPHVNERSGYREYLWKLDHVPPLFEDSETPAWYDPYSRVQLSDMGSWQEVVDWALPLYQPPEQLSPELEEFVAAIQRTHYENEDRVAAVLRFVQDEVRYMGIEIGPQSHAPTDPSTVFARRFGDCKDKTLLGLTLLRRLGIQADSALVHSRLVNSVESSLPSPTAFNHVILKVVCEGRTYWLDPTIRLQRGALDQLYQPNYGSALVLSATTTGLEPVAVADHAQPTTYIEDTYDLRSGVAKDALYTIKTVYTRQSADSRRRQFAKSSKDELQRDFLNFYADQFPSIQLAKEMDIVDDEHRNRITVSEYYRLPDVWKKREKSNDFQVVFNPKDFKTYFRAPGNSLRTMPFGIYHPTHVRQKTIVQLPEKWTIEASQSGIEDSAFLFDMEVGYVEADDTLIIEYGYRTKKDSVAAAEVAMYMENLDRVSDELGYYISIAQEALPAASPADTPTVVTREVNWTIVLLAVILLLVIVAAATKLYRYDPPAEQLPLSAQSQSGIGGWLLLVAIGLVIQPIKLLATSYEQKWIFQLEEWTVLTSPGSEAFHPLWAPALIFELSANMTLVVFSVLLVILFLLKRSSVPKLYIYFAVWAIFVSIADSLLVASIPAASSQAGPADHSALIRQGLFAVIWSAYFLKSERVKATFTRRRERDPVRVATVDQPQPGAAAGLEETRLCPLCSTEVIKRVATNGPLAGQAYLVCSAYPKCRHAVPLSG